MNGIEYVSANRMRFWPPVYSPEGVLLYDARNFYQVDNPGSGTMTLAQWYGAGNSFVVRDIELACHIGIGNEGRGVGPQPGESWYVANFSISTSGWIGDEGPLAQSWY